MSEHFDVILSVFSGAIKQDLVQLEVYCLVIFCLIIIFLSSCQLAHISTLPRL